VLFAACEAQRRFPAQQEQGLDEGRQPIDVVGVDMRDDHAAERGQLHTREE